MVIISCPCGETVTKTCRFRPFFHLVRLKGKREVTMGVSIEQSKVEIDPEFNEEQHDIWRTLMIRQGPQVQKYACKEYLEGAEILKLPEAGVPSIQWMNERITPRTGWRTVRTAVRYSNAVQWYAHFAKKQFLVTDYLRSREELDFTPEPDMFHDIYGHLPYFILPRYVEIQEMFAPAFHKAKTDELREGIKRLAWFSTEFGLIRENGELKVFGTGLISSKAEMEYVLAGNTPLLPFKAETIINYEKAIFSYNSQLFVFESLEALKEELARYFATL
jgi:phenylalanine-4-hydroxylase